MTARRLSAAAWAAAILFGSLLAFTLYLHHRAGAALLHRAQVVGRYRARHAADQVGEALAGLEAVSHALAGDLERGRLKPEGIAGRLPAALRSAPAGTLTLGVYFQPGAAGQGRRLFAPCAGLEGGKLSRSQDESLEDYTAQPWYRTDLARGAWDEPHKAASGNRVQVAYLEPFRMPGAGASSGVVRLEVDLASLQKVIDGLGLGFEGYGFVLSARSEFLADPAAEEVQGRETLAAVAERLRDPGLKRIAQAALKGQPGFAECTSEVTGQKVLTFLEPVPSSSWSAGVSLFKEELNLQPESHNRLVLVEVTLAVALAWVLLFLLFKGPTLAPRSLWWTIGAGALAVLAGMGFLFHTCYSSPPLPHDEEIRVMDTLSLERFKSKYCVLNQEQGRRVEAEYLPTGVFLETVDISGPTQVRLTGMIWQRLPLDTPKEVRGIVLPEASTGDVSLGIEKKSGDALVQYYPFKITTEPEMSSKVYPFDRIRARLRLWPKDWTRNVVLVPDLGAYPLLGRSAFPGVDWELDEPGWEVEGCEFAYALENYSTNFGLPDFVGRRQSPELVYNIVLKRQFLGPFIVAFLPVLAVSILLFTHVLTVTLDPAKIKATAYAYTNYLRNLLTLFFSLVVSQFNIRNRIVADGVLYVEWFYFIMYLAVLAAAVDAQLYGKHGETGYHFHDNELPRLLFWPVLLASFYAVSAMYVL